ncbi:MAG: hypothetical protein ACI396_00325 [Acutalibacteraceae bacterium]
MIGVIAVPFNAIVWIVLVLLAVIGLSAVIRGISHAIFSSGFPQCCCTVAVLYGNEADAALRGAIEQAAYEHVYDKGYNSRKIIAVDMGLEPNMRSMCEMICNDYNITLCDERTLNAELKMLRNNSKTE